MRGPVYGLVLMGGREWNYARETTPQYPRAGSHFLPSRAENRIRTGSTLSPGISIGAHGRSRSHILAAISVLGLLPRRGWKFDTIPTRGPPDYIAIKPSISLGLISAYWNVNLLFDFLNAEHTKYSSVTCPSNTHPCSRETGETRTRWMPGVLLYLRCPHRRV